MSILAAALLGAVAAGAQPQCTGDCNDSGTVAINEATRCAPNQANVARYRELQAVQDRLSLALRGVFADQRKLA